ncbi:UDP-N-acetylglucosamine 2-epimerase (non-hydrolyzing) [Allokutzneria sp. A3M-2-11 16]|uniref:non-hydrolyzing UDP-N-acetylglucosamine 2-epimerase n=1 Tax=Allokutzneria sp. A3M-2-11 16 TaxID=2962043 RepID=UPI0020B84B3B|nr:UDP-N-acetylglucosamine 2-epimerase (non-hydrolyzing) [Allokutzneria sp. A3M-2-11 16]MCP3804824.1 UDP-N-acetylglucosamine 2-epimerase (non-hydrolyzing) [Allokutzneria sp. A3M-2-11 16]
MNEKILLVTGTRSESVKLAPVALAMRDDPRTTPVIVNSGQHERGVAETLGVFGLAPDVVLRPRRNTGGQGELVTAVANELDAVLTAHAPAAVLVQGDTATGLAAALAAFWRRIPIVHLEAGLRTRRLDAPFPEEGNRQMIARIASLHLAPTSAAAAELQAESLASQDIVVTGNTVFDALDHVSRTAGPTPGLRVSRADDELRLGRRLVVATAHRRESWGQPLRQILSGILGIAEDHPDVLVLFPVHPNPALVEEVLPVLGGHPRIMLTPALSYPDMVWALRHAALVVSDSGGLQEESAIVGVPMLVTREATERPESIVDGQATLVGADTGLIRATARARLAERANPRPVRGSHAAPKVVEAVLGMLRRPDQVALSGCPRR